LTKVIGRFFVSLRMTSAGRVERGLRLLTSRRLNADAKHQVE